MLARNHHGRGPYLPAIRANVGYFIAWNEGRWWRFQQQRDPSALSDAAKCLKAAHPTQSLPASYERMAADPEARSPDCRSFDEAFWTAWIATCVDR